MATRPFMAGLAIASLALSMLLISTTASADDAQARAFFNVARQAFDKGDYDGALGALEQAHKLSGRDTLLYNMALALHRRYSLRKSNDDLRRAVDTYRKYLEKVPDGSKRNDAVIALGQLEPELAKLPANQPAGDDVYGDDSQGGKPKKPPEPATRTGLMISCQTDGAIIELDGRQKSSSPFIVDTTSGQHVVRVYAPGFRMAEQQVLVQPGAVVAVAIELEAMPATLHLTGVGGGSVKIDGKYAGALPLRQPLEVAPGEHFVAVTRNGYKPYTTWLDLGRADRRELPVSMELSTQRYAAWATIFAGSASFVVGAVLGGVALSKENEAQQIADRRESASIGAEEVGTYEDAIESRDAMRVGAGIGLGVGAAAIVVGAIMYVVDEPDVVAPPRREGPRDEDEQPGELELQLGMAATPEMAMGSLQLSF